MAATVCRVLGVSTSGYYAWRIRDLSARALKDAELMGLILEIHQGSKGIYGAPRVHAELTKSMDVRCSRKHAARLMREADLAGVHRRRNRGCTRCNPTHDLAPDHLTGEGKLYSAAITDACSHMVVGWAMVERATANWSRRP